MAKSSKEMAILFSRQAAEYQRLASEQTEPALRAIFNDLAKQSQQLAMQATGPLWQRALATTLKGWTRPITQSSSLSNGSHVTATARRLGSPAVRAPASSVAHRRRRSRGPKLGSGTSLGQWSALSNGGRPSSSGYPHNGRACAAASADQFARDRRGSHRSAAPHDGHLGSCWTAGLPAIDLLVSAIPSHRGTRAIGSGFQMEMHSLRGVFPCR